MKRKNKETRGLIKGAPTAVIVSVAIHAALLLLAGGLVVFNVIKKQEKVFEPPPPIERKKMELKKPKVKVKKPARPQSSQRITSKSTQSSSDIQLPAVSSVGEGLGSGLGGFELMPDVSDISLFGSDRSVAMGNDFEGTFYSLSYDNQGNETGMGHGGALDVLKTFHEYDWNPRVFATYYRSPQKLYATHFMIPPFQSWLGPQAFGIEDPDFNTEYWVVYYKGEIASRNTSEFRFWGFGDDVFLVRINGQVVFEGAWDDTIGIVTDYRTSSDEHWTYYMAHGGAAVGDWFTLEADTPVEMEVLMEENGGMGGFMLMIQDKNEYYPKNRDGMPILPAFKTAEFSETAKARIEYDLIPGEANLDSKVMFNVY